MSSPNTSVISISSSSASSGLVTPILTHPVDILDPFLALNPFGQLVVDSPASSSSPSPVLVPALTPLVTNPDKDTSGENTNRYNLRRCLRYRMGYSIKTNENVGVLDRNRKRNFDKCAGTYNHYVCDSPTSSCLCQSNHRNKKRQHDGNQVCPETRGYSIRNSTITRLDNQCFGSETQHTNTMPSYSGGGQHYSRSTQSDKETSRMDSSSPSPPNIMQMVALSTNDRCIRRSEQQSSQSILELSAGSDSSSDRRLSTTVVIDRTIPSPSLEAGSTGPPPSKNLASQESTNGDSLLADAALVANDDKTSNTRSGTNPVVQKQNPGRLAIITLAYQESGLGQESGHYLTKKNRDSTSRQYDMLWNRFWTWCSDQEPPRDPLAYAPNTVVDWLTSNSSVSKPHLNSMRSSVASVYAVLHQDKPALAYTPAVQAFFQARRNQQRVVPRKMDEAWPIKRLLDLYRAWGNNEDMGLSRLQDKTIGLLCTATMWRPRSDVGNLRWMDLEWHWDKNDSSKLVGVRILAREPKEASQKYSTLATLRKKSEMCPVATLFCYYQRTQELRVTLRQEHSLFLSYLEHAEKPVGEMSKATVAQRLKDSMAAAGIDTRIHRPHSIRSASSTAAYQKGIKLRHIKTHANWSLGSTTFERYYLKPNDNFKKAQKLLGKLILDDADKNTTSGSRAEASKIVTGTNHN